ncbi:ABC transporter permease [Nocardiopsis exhalans]|uniref:ABC transporter permease n=1 Tax=Nocardiopsis exhalans TaxID=163604 RepID=A0ABY5D6X4_9ACTN|nr:ABC transporter permease [Nocardiopsis exhalans]USY19762.1 ABC transporter permease [Nocardiopsis exhalans]
MSSMSETVLDVLMVLSVIGALVCTVAGAVWNRRRGFTPFQVMGPARGFGHRQHLDEHRREGNGPHIAERHRHATRIIQRGERAESPRLALLVCHWAAQDYENWENPWAVWNAVFLAPLFGGFLALTDRIAPAPALVTAVVLFVAALALPLYRVRVLRRSAWAIETNRDLAESAGPASTT